MSTHGTIVDRLFARAERRPDEIAYRFHEGRSDGTNDLTAGELDHGARAIGAVLQSRRLEGRRVVLALPHAPEFLTAFFGCLAAGAVAVPVPMQRAGRQDPRFASVVENAEPDLVIADAASAPWLREAVADRASAPAVATVAELTGDPGSFRRTAIDEDALAVLQYTSGSTGDPKGVMISHRNFVHNVGLIIGKLRLDASSRGVLWLPFYHDMGLVGAVIVPMQVEGTADIMSPQAFVQSPMSWLRKLSAARATTAVAPNFALERCCDMATPEALADLDLSSLTCLLTGSEPVNPNTLERFAETFGPCGYRHDACMPSYGLAESTLLVTGNLRDGAGPTVRGFDAGGLAAHRAAAPVDGAPVRRLVGNGSPEGRVRIADPETGRPLGEGAVGEIWVRGESVAKGYWGRPDLSADAFGARLAGEPDAGPFYRTGDLGFLQADDLFVTGRRKSLIILRGRNLYPQDLEETATRDLPHLATGAAAAFSVDRGRGEEVVLLAEATRGGVTALKDEGEASALVSRMLRRLADGHEVRPLEIAIVKPGRLPRTSSGKIQHGEARREWEETGFAPYLVHGWSRPAADAAAPGPAALPLDIRDRAGVETWLIERLARHSGQSAHRIDLDEPFANYGLDSVAAVETIAAINELEIGARKVQPTDLYDYPTVTRLLDHMFASVPDRASRADEAESGAGGERDIDREAAALRALLDG